MAGFLGNLAIVVATLGIYLGCSFPQGNAELSLQIIAVTTVGISGITAFLRHVIFHKSDAKRLGWETDRPEWMMEVGFANLAFGLVALLAVISHQPAPVLAFSILGYGIYLIQAGILHGYHYVSDSVRRPSRLWRSCLLTLAYALMISFIAIRQLLAMPPTA